MISQPNESACLLKFGTHVCQTSKQGRVKLQKAPATRTSAENIFTDCVRRDQQQDLRIACDAVSSKNLRIACDAISSKNLRIACDAISSKTCGLRATRSAAGLADCVRRDQQQDLRIACDAVSSKKSCGSLRDQRKLPSLRNLCTAALSFSAVYSISSSVLNSLKLKRIAPSISFGESPIAFSTCEPFEEA